MGHKGLPHCALNNICFWFRIKMNIFVIAKVQNIHYVKQKMQKKKDKV